MIRAAAPALLLAAAQAIDAGAGPPGTVLVPGGRTAIGTDPAEVERRIARDPEAMDFAGALSAETPRWTADVPSFRLMATEVTNEQYAAYVRAAGARPPETWGRERIDAARQRYSRTQQDERDRAFEEGRPDPGSLPFDGGAWWKLHWSEPSPDLPAWEIPPGEALHPVVFVDWDEARAYARWAGMRLPTELEYQRAVRGDAAHDYPWGDGWEDGSRAATRVAESRSGAAPVGSFPLGASRQGVLDLAGNVWEWTASPYLPFPGYAPRVLEVGFGPARRTVNAIADWDAGQRVVVGGSFQNGPLMARATTRRATDRGQAADALGFRCAASLRPGLDVAAAILEQDLTPNVRARDPRGMVAFALEETVCADGWATAEPGDLPRPPRYAVITDYRYVLYTPVRVVPANDPGTLDRLAEAEGLVPLGFLATNVAGIEPDLPPGVYQAYWRKRGPRSTASRPSEAEGPPFEEVLRIDASLDNLVLFDALGRPALAWPVRLAWETRRESSAAWLAPEEAPRTGQAETSEGTRMLRMDLCVRSSSGQKGFVFELSMRLATQGLGVDWRPR